jgi:hypothetical protein
MTSKPRLAQSRIRYAAANPPCTMRFTPQALQKIVTLRERLGGSFNHAVNVAVDEFDDAAIAAIHVHSYDQGLREGVKLARAAAYPADYAAAFNLFRVTVPCHSCGQAIELRFDNSSADFVRDVLID